MDGCVMLAVNNMESILYFTISFACNNITQTSGHGGYWRERRPETHHKHYTSFRIYLGRKRRVIPSHHKTPSADEYVAKCRCDLRSQVVSRKQPKLGLTQELSFSRISESTTGYIFTSYFYIPRHGH